jgi:alpha-galactosidase
MKLETEAWSEHRLFKVILEKFHLFPITSDSHFGEYIQWAYDSVDHKGILDFYRFYKDFLSTIEPHIELKLKERVVPIMEGIITNSGYFEEAVNVPNNGLIADLPDWIVVEVPAIMKVLKKCWMPCWITKPNGLDTCNNPILSKKIKISFHIGIPMWKLIQ